MGKGEWVLRFLLLIGFFVAFFLVIWILSYASHTKRQKASSWLIWGASGLVAALTLYWSGVDFLNPTKRLFDGTNLEGMSLILGGLSFLWGVSALFIYLSKQVFLRLHMLRLKDLEVVRRILLLAKNHHNLFGWITLAAATGHGAYFLIHPARSAYEFWTGVGAWVALALLATSGLWMGRVVADPDRAKLTRMYHGVLTLGYVAVLALHFNGSLLLTVFLLLAAFAALFLMWGFLRLKSGLRTE